jgi:tetratricopeptide (TPR) repeat protein
MKRYDEVVKDANEVLFLDANNVPARALLGRAFKASNEYQQAEEQLSHAILLDSNQAALYTGRCFSFFISFVSTAFLA